METYKQGKKKKKRKTTLLNKHTPNPCRKQVVYYENNLKN